MGIKSGKVFANSIAMYNEKSLLTKDKIIRLSEAPFSDAVKMLHDYGYGEGVLGNESYVIDAFIDRETNILIKFVNDECADAHLRKHILARYDYNNAKVIYKKRFSIIDTADILFETGNEQALISADQQRDYTFLPESMRAAFIKLDKQEEIPPSPREIDIAFTNAMYKDYLKNSVFSRTLRKFTVGEIDLKNILTSLRCRHIKANSDTLETMLIVGGSIPFDNIKNILTSDDGEISGIFEKTPYGGLIEDYFKAGRSNLAGLETAADNYVFLSTKKQVYNMSGIDPFFRFYFKKLIEIKNVKIILICLKNNKKQEIAGRLRFIDE